MVRQTLTCLLPLLLSLGTTLALTAWAADRDGPALRGSSPSVQHSPPTAAQPAQRHRLSALLRTVSACIEAPPVAATVADRVSRAITLGFRN